MASGSRGAELMEEIMGGWPGVKQWSAPPRGGLPGTGGERRDGSCLQQKFEIFGVACCVRVTCSV
jgi:hypothetical protein